MLSRALSIEGEALAEKLGFSGLYAFALKRCIVPPAIFEAVQGFTCFSDQQRSILATGRVSASTTSRSSAAMAMGPVRVVEAPPFLFLSNDGRRSK